MKGRDMFIEEGAAVAEDLIFLPQAKRSSSSAGTLLKAPAAAHFFSTY
jgi:hypothetical protein